MKRTIYLCCIFAVAWFLTGSTAFLLGGRFGFPPELIRFSKNSPIVLTVKARECYYLMIVAEGAEYPKSVVGPKDVKFSWSEPVGQGDAVTVVEESDFKMQQLRGSEITVSAKSIVQFTPAKSGLLNIVVEIPESSPYSIGVFSGAGRVGAVIFSTLAIAVAITGLVFWFTRKRIY